VEQRTVSTITGELADREAIRDCLSFYCRACDRRDVELMRQVYWPDAIDDHGMMPPMTAEEFIDRMETEGMPGIEGTQHMLGGNVLIDIVGTTAYVESYVHAYHRCTRENGEEFDILTGARYIDKMEKRGDQWRIARRVARVDWLREYDDTANPEYGFRGAPFERGGHKPNDDSYELLRHER
jgi:ketosteroid isomerase-like protein